MERVFLMKSMLKTGYWAFVLVFFLSFSAEAQKAESKIEKLGKEYQIYRDLADKRVKAYQEKHKVARFRTTGKGVTYLLDDVTESGIPVYIKTFNDDVAIDLNVKQLRTGGTLGLNLLGTGMKVGLWDGGRVRGDHVELTGRVTQQDGFATLDDHATHVAGTILASGIKAHARGMAPEATMLAHEFSNDIIEMTALAKPDQTSLLFSNHSYGRAGGWDEGVWRGDPSVSNNEDYSFGFYDGSTSQWDNLAFTAPYYTIVKSAGNDRNESGGGPQPADGPYDCITTNGNAKNIITVGAVLKLAGPYVSPSSVIMSSFSSWGPTDDGRIKPDLVAPGVSVESPISTQNNLYAFFDGTSMSSPAVTGSLVLLQQLYKNLNGGNVMRAATLKALAIHTAREAGANPGPDYSFGWGLLDAEAAAKVITGRDDQNIIITEASLASGQSYEVELNPKAGEKITATLVWTDPAGTPVAPSLNPTTKMLVNDLDMRLTEDITGGLTFFPWTLDPAPSKRALAAVQTGDNFRDNVEKMEFDNPLPRKYKLKVTHKLASLVSGPQKFSLIITYNSIVDSKISYYWIGDSGDWNDPAHWSLTSGGTAAASVPGADNRVVFDENSFSGDGEAVTMTQNESCYSMRWFAQEATNFSMASHELTVNESLLLLSSQISLTTPGMINFLGAPNTNYQVGLSNNSFADLSLKFTGDNSLWSLTGDFSLDKIALVQGKVELTGGKSKINMINTSGVLTKGLSLLNAELSGLQSLNIDLTNATLDTKNSSIKVVTANPVYSLNFGTNDFAGLINIASGEVSIAGSGSIAKVEGKGVLKAIGNHFFKNLSLDGGSQLIFQTGSTQTFTDTLTLKAQNGNRILFKSDATGKAFFSFDKYYKICLDYLDIENIDVVGQSVVNSGINSTLVNSINWLSEDCSSITFPDFTFANNCIQSSTLFTNKSNGPITTYSWDFGDAASGKNGSSLPSPIHDFNQAGNYLVTLEVSNGTAPKKKVTKTVEVNIPNSLPQNHIVINNSKLTSFTPASKYTWVLNEELVDNSNTRAISFTDKPGDYTVLIFDQLCNRRSDPFIVSAVEDESPVVIKAFTLFPNPADDKLFIQKGAGLQVKAIHLTDLLGRQRPIEVMEYNEALEIDLSSLESGIYVIQVLSDTGVFKEKIIVR